MSLKEYKNAFRGRELKIRNFYYAGILVLSSVKLICLFADFQVIERDKIPLIYQL
jgi:hypothetical protein